jgi:hypothetical protein
MSDTPEPAPLTEREMNQFIMLAALPTLERALERLRWLEAQRGGLTNPTSIMVRIDEGWITPSDAVREITRLRAEVAALKAQPDPLAEMWRELAAYQPQADRDGHGDTWRAMCAERTGAAARAAARAAYPSSAASAAGWATDAAVALANAGQAEAESAIFAIRRAKEVLR